MDWDRKNSVIHSGAYIAEKEARDLGNILDMNMNLWAYALEKLRVNRVSIEILGNNPGQIRWMPRFGAVKEGVLRQAVRKNEQYYDLHLFSFLASEWQTVLERVHFRRIEIEDPGFVDVCGGSGEGTTS